MWLMVGHSLSWGSPNSRSQGCWTSLPNAMLAGVKLVVSWAVARRKMGSLLSQSLRCDLLTFHRLSIVFVYHCQVLFSGIDDYINCYTVV
jgi:hypothetical protein